VMSGALTFAASEASSLDSAKPPASIMPGSKRGVQRNATKANQVPTPARVAKTNRLKHSRNGQGSSTNAASRRPPHSGARQSATVAKSGSIQNKPVTGVSAVRRPSMFPSASPALDNLRRRGPNPAVISGLGTSKLSETGAINGSRMSRKP
jgi:hypothetical protein